MTLGERLDEVKTRIAAAARESGRSPEAIRLVVVGKTFPADAVAEAIRAGATEVGENKVQEAVQKRPAIDLPARWHLIGHLQSNKSRHAAETFDVVETVDSVALASRLSRHVAELGRSPLEILLQVRQGGEETKSGLAEAAVVEVARAVVELPGLIVSGLMSIPPPADDPRAVEPWVHRLAALAAAVRAELPPAARPTFRELSIGMSHDFEAAIRAGATIVRVGSAIFGPRPPLALGGKIG